MASEILESEIWKIVFCVCVFFWSVIWRSNQMAGRRKNFRVLCVLLGYTWNDKTKYFKCRFQHLFDSWILVLATKFKEVLCVWDNFQALHEVILTLFPSSIKNFDFSRNLNQRGFPIFNSHLLFCSSSYHFHTNFSNKSLYYPFKHQITISAKISTTVLNKALTKRKK